MLHKVFKIAQKAGQTKTGIFKNQEFNSELHKPVTRKFRRCKVYSCHQDNIAGANLAGMQVLSRYNKGAWVKVVSSTIDQLNHGCMSMALKCNQHTRRKNIRTLKTKILWLAYQKVYTLISYMKRFAHTSKHHATIKIKPSDVTQGYWLSCWTEHNDKDLKFKIGYNVITSKKKKKKKKKVFYEGLHTKIKIWSKEVLLIKKVKILYHGYTSSAISTNYWRI